MEAEVKTKKSVKTTLLGVVRYLLAVAAGAAIGIGADKLGLDDQQADAVKSVVTNTIKGEEVSDADKAAAKEAVENTVKDTVAEKTSKK